MKWVIALFIALALLVSASRYIGHHELPIVPIEEMHFNDCELQCWIGIVPGKTTLREATLLLESRYPEADGYRIEGNRAEFTVVSSKSQMKFNIQFGVPAYRYDSDAPILVVWLWFNQGGPPVMVGDMYEFLGHPDYVLLDGSQLFFVTNGVVAKIEDLRCGGIDITQHVDHLILSPGQLQFREPVTYLAKWAGFKTC